MINTVEVYSTLQIADELTFDTDGPIEADFVQVTNVDGLDPVKASIDVVSSGNVDGAISLESQVPTRNIVMTLRPNPDWINWTNESLRTLIYSYFIPKTLVKLIFDSDEIGVPVEILGTVESCEANPFTKDPEYIVSIVCPDPYFVTVDPVIVIGTVISQENWETSKNTITLNGNIPIGIQVRMGAGFEDEIYIQAGTPGSSSFHVVTTVPGYFHMGSIPLHKYIQGISAQNGSFQNLLAYLQLGSKWPVFYPGENSFAVMGSSVGNPWELKYFPKYGGI